MSSPNRPNIVYIHTHDLGRYIEPYGHAIPTPNMQRLAEEGVTFRHAFCAGPTCSPSRAALVTGQSPHSCGVLGLAHRGHPLKHPERHIAQTLSRQGYVTALIGFQHVTTWNDDAVRKLGYDEVLRGESNRMETLAPHIREFLRRKHEKPFFVSIGFTDCHRDWVEDSAVADGRYVLPPAPLPDTAEVRQDLAGLISRAKAYDDGVGLILKYVDQQGLAENTLVICTTDHGIAFPRMKCNLTHHGTGVLLVMRGPGGFAGGQVTDALVSQIDLFPTVCDLAGLDRPAWLEGESLLPLVTGQADSVREEVFTEVTYHAAYEPKRSVRTRRYNYVRRFHDYPTPVLPNCDDSPSKSLLLDHGWAELPEPREQLYDLIHDPNEAHNLSGSDAYADVQADLADRLERWMRETGDPLLDGPVLVKGAVANPMDSDSPTGPTIVLDDEIL